MAERRWRPVTPPTKPTSRLNQFGQAAVPDIPGNAHLSGLDKLQIEKAHASGGWAAIPHVDASGQKCQTCVKPTRKTRPV